MSGPIPVLMAERVLLGLGLPLGGMCIGGLSAGVGISAGLHEPGISVIGVLGTLLGIVAISRLAPRIVPNASRFSPTRRITAGVAGFLAARVVGRCLSLLGLDADALSHSGSTWPIAQEGLFMLSTFGTMLLTGGAALGRPNVANDSVSS